MLLIFFEITACLVKRTLGKASGQGPIAVIRGNEMRKLFRGGMAVALAAALTTSISIGVTPLHAQTGATIVSRPQDGNILRTGAEIRLTTRTELSSRTNHVGDRFDLEVAEPVMLNGQVVIPAGTPGVGEVTRVRKKGMWGRRGIIEVRMISLRMGDRTIRITGNGNDRGRAGTGGVVAAVLTVPVVGFFVTGTSAVIPPGTVMVATLNEDLEVAFNQP